LKVSNGHFAQSRPDGSIPKETFIRDVEANVSLKQKSNDYYCGGEDEKISRRELRSNLARRMNFHAY
jgi:hypothetical protein